MLFVLLLVTGALSLVMHFSLSGHVFLSLQVHGSMTSHCGLLFSNYMCVVLRNYRPDLDCVSVENLM